MNRELNTSSRRRLMTARRTLQGQIDFFDLMSNSNLVENKLAQLMIQDLRSALERLDVAIERLRSDYLDIANS